MEERESLYKIYDNMFNVIGLADYEKVHREGLLHQVVHFWLLERAEDGLWFYIQKRPEDDPVYRGAYDLLSCGHIDPEETHEDALLYEVKSQLGLTLKKENIRHLGSVKQEIDVDDIDFHDHVLIQSFLCETDKPLRHFPGKQEIRKVRCEDMAAFASGEAPTIQIYDLENVPLYEVDENQWWDRQEECRKLVIPQVG